MNKHENLKPKINIETIRDLYKIPFNILKESKIYDFKGKYFDKLYEEALMVEQKEMEKKSAIKFIYSKSSFNNNDPINNNKNQISLKNNKLKNNQSGNDNENKIKKIKERKEIRSQLKKSSVEINISNEDINLFGRQRLNSVQIPSKKSKEIKIKRLEFKISYNTQMGEEIGLIGSIKELGNWKEKDYLRMYWNKGNIWNIIIDVSFIEFQYFEYKFILISDGNIKEWENGNNRIFNQNDYIQTILEKQKYNQKISSIEEIDFEYKSNEQTLILKCIWNQK